METIPADAQPIIDELMQDKLIAETPSLTADQWIAIAGLAHTFSEQGPNRNARHVRRKLAYFHMIRDAERGQSQHMTE